MKWPWNARTEKLAIAEREMLKAIAMLRVELTEVSITLDEMIVALNAFSAIVGLEWDETAKKWVKLDSSVSTERSPVVGTDSGQV